MEFRATKGAFAIGDDLGGSLGFRSKGGFDLGLIALEFQLRLNRLPHIGEELGTACASDSKEDVEAIGGFE